MPYKSNADLPAAVKGLPEHAKDIFRAAFNSAMDQDNSEESAFRIAWAAVKRKYRKEGDHWVARDAGENVVMDMEWEETITFDATNLRRSSDGYLVGESRAARSGIQQYRGAEMGDSRAVVRVYRPPEEVFDRASLTSFAHKPLTLNHPPELVTSSNWRKYAVGHLDGMAAREVAEDGEYVRVPWYLFDAAAIDAVESGRAKQLSVGYRADISFEDGETSKGEKYDAVQRGIRVNHLAIVPVARGGPALRLGDEDRREKMPKIIVVDGISLTLPDQDADIVQRHINSLSQSNTTALADVQRLTGELATAVKDSQTKDGQIAVLTQQVKDATLTPEQLDARVKDRASVVAKAQMILGDAFKADGISDADVKRQAVAKKLSEAVAKPMTDAAIDGAFTALTADYKAPTNGGGGQDFARNLLNAQSTQDAQTARDKAWEDRGNQQRDAWRKAEFISTAH